MNKNVRETDPPGDGSLDDPYQALHLLPGVPQELIAEVYWHLVGRLHEAAAENPSASVELQHLNDAYARVMDPARRDGVDRSLRARQPAPPGRDVKISWAKRLIGGRTSPVDKGEQPAEDAWAMLHLLPTAQIEIAELAHRFWRGRVRGQWDIGAEDELARLDDAYARVLTALAQPSDEGTVAQPSDEGTANGGAAVGDESMDTGGNADPSDAAEPDAVERDPRTVNVEAPTAQPEQSRARSGALRVARTIGRLSAAAGTRLGATVGAGMGRAGEVLKSRMADPFHEYDPDAPEDGPVEPEHAGAEQAALEQRLSDLARRHSVTMLGDREDILNQWAPSGLPDFREGMKSDETASEDTSAGVIPGFLRGDSEPPMEQAVKVPQVGHAELIREDDGMSFVLEIGAGLFSIGTEPTSDLVPSDADANRNQLFARIWWRDRHFVLHVVAPSPAVLLNEETVRWAVLEDGDVLKIGRDEYRFVCHPNGTEPGSQHRKGA